jgi:hypothetical protein
LRRSVISLSEYVKCSHKKKVSHARHWWLTPVIPATQEAETRDIPGLKPSTGKQFTSPYPENKYPDGLDQVIDNLHSKSEALSSNPSTNKRKERK